MDRERLESVIIDHALSNALKYNKIFGTKEIEHFKEDFTRILKKYMAYYRYLNKLFFSWPFDESPKPDEITNEQLNIFNNFMRYLNISEISNHTVDLFAVLCNTKTIAYIDYSSYDEENYKLRKDNSNKKDLKLRYYCTSIGIEKIRIITDDGISILYYWPENWTNVAILYKYKNDKLDLPTSDLKPMRRPIGGWFGYDQDMYVVFQSILLGYSSESILEHLTCRIFRRIMIDNNDLSIKDKYKKMYNVITKYNTKYYGQIYDTALEFIQSEKNKLTEADKLFFRGI